MHPAPCTLHPAPAPAPGSNPATLQTHTCILYPGGTQQCDLSTKRGGVIARLKALFRKDLRKQFRAALERPERRGVVAVAEIAALLEKAAEESWQPESGVQMNQQVGYYIDPVSGYLQWDPLRDEPLPASGGASSSTSNEPLPTTRSAVREKIMAVQDSQRTALAQAASRINAAQDAVVTAVPSNSQPRPAMLPPPTLAPIPRSGPHP